MSTFPFLQTLSLFTLIAIVAFAIWQFRSTRRSQARHGEQPGEVKSIHHAPGDGAIADAPGAGLGMARSAETVQPSAQADPVTAAAASAAPTSPHAESGDGSTRSARLPEPHDAAR